MIMQDIEKTLIAILSKHDVARIGIFGSCARGEAHPGSDLDVLVDFRKTKSLLTLVRIERELSEALGIKVDLLTEGAISPHLIDRIKADLKVIYQ
jgi:hypothetical protein